MTNTLKSLLENPRSAFGVLGGYFALHVVLRSLISDSLQTDEAEQCLVTQVWLWGYGSQPPLYTWLQILVFAGLGVNVFALALLKNTLLFSVYLFTYLTAREIFRETRHALLATFSLLLIVLFAWESQRDQTHLVLATSLAAATMFAAVRLFKCRSPGWYCWLGVLAGLGVLAKYNYAAVIVSLLLAAISLPALRPVVLDRRILLTLACFLVVTTPHAYWAWTNPKLVFSQADKFEIPQSGDFLMASLSGAGLMLKRMVEFAAGPLVVFGLLFFRARRISEAKANHLLVTLIQRTIIIGLGVCLLLVLGFHVTSIRARWLQPLLISLPLVFVAGLQPRLDAGRVKALLTLCLLVMLTVPAALAGQVLAAGWLNRPGNLNIPYRDFARQIRAAGFTRGLIVCDGHMVAGNLRLHFPDSTILASGLAWSPATHSETPMLIVWQPANEPGPTRYFLQSTLRRFQIDPEKLPSQKISAPALYAPNKMENLCFAVRLLAATPTGSSPPQGSAMQ